jgi:biotin carboxyl carrier protein
MKYQVMLNGMYYEAEIIRLEETAAPVHPKEVASVPERDSFLKLSDSFSGTEQERISSPMPGKIIDVPVRTGDRVRAGQTMALLEAMKMENEIPASCDGVVSEVCVKKGDMVETDALLVKISRKEV